MDDRKKLFACYGIIIDNVTNQLGIVKGKTKFKKELRGRLFDLYKTEYAEGLVELYKDHSDLCVSNLSRPLLSHYIRFILMTLESEFGIFAETPNEKGTKDLTLQEYLKFINKDFYEN
jgi:hypothetical protein